MYKKVVNENWTQKNLDLLMHAAILGLITTQKVLFLGLKY